MHLALPTSGLDGGAHMCTGKTGVPTLLVFTTYSMRMFFLMVNEDCQCH